MNFHVECVGIFRLVLNSGYILDLLNKFFVPSFSKNLVSISSVKTLGFEFNFVNLNVYGFKNSTFVDLGILNNGLYIFNLDIIF